MGDPKKAGCLLGVCIASFVAGTQTLKPKMEMEWNGTSGVPSDGEAAILSERYSGVTVQSNS